MEDNYENLTVFELRALISAHAESLEEILDLIEASGDAENETTLTEAQEECNHTLDTIAALTNVVSRKVMADEEDDKE